MISSQKFRYRYQEIIDALEEEIATGKYEPGCMLPTENELAAQFQVNRLTVRKALEFLKRRGRISSHPGRGTYVRGDDDSRRLVTLLFVGDIEGKSHADQYLAYARQAHLMGYRLFGVHPQHLESCDEAAMAREMTDVQGLIVDTTYNYRRLTAFLEKSDLPVVGIGYEISTVASTGLPLARPIYYVLKDQGAAIEKAVAYLVCRGHRRIALVVNPVEIPSWRPEMPKGREYGAYFAALVRYGVEDYANVVVFPGDGTPAVDAVAQLFPENKRRWPTAVICDSDYRARHLYAIAAERDIKIPAEISLIGQGDTPWAQSYSPALTSLDMGNKYSAALALKLVRAPLPEETVVVRIEPKIVERASVAPTAAR